VRLPLAEATLQPGAERSLDEALGALFAGDAELCANPYPLYRRLRDESPIHFFNRDLVAVSRYDDAKAVYRDSDRFRQWKGETGMGDQYALLSEGEVELFTAQMTYLGKLAMSALDGDDHRRVRDVMHRQFTPRRIAGLASVTQEVTDELLAPMRGSSVCDLHELAYRVPLYVILALLGMPREDAEQIRTWGKDTIYHKGRTRLEPEGVRRQARAWRDFGEYVDTMVDARRRDPGRTDLIAAFVDAEDGARLSRDELVVTLIQIVTGGHDTVSNLIGNGLAALLRDRDQWDLLCSDPDGHAPGAVEEALRYDASIQSMQRIASQDTTIAGVDIPAGTKVLVIQAAANRDPAAFADPDRFDITRQPNDHLTFSHGPHYCLGASLARLELRTVFATLAQRFPGLELAVPYDELEWSPSPALRGLSSLPVRLA
jgi:cytochrome P450